MSTRQEGIRYEFEAVSNLPTVAEQLAKIIELSRQQGVVVTQQTEAIKAQFAQQTATVKAELQNQVAESKASLQQQTAAVKAAFSDQTDVVRAELKKQQADLSQQTASVKSELNQQTAAVKAELNQQTAAAKAELNQQTAAVRAEFKQQQALTEQQTTAIRAEFNQQTAAVKAELNQQTAAVRAELKEQTLASQAAINQQTASVKAEFNQQTAAVKAELNRQTAAYKSELIEQRAELRKNGDSINSIVGQLRDFRTIVGASFSVYEIAQFGQQIVDAKSKLDIFRTGLNQMIGDKREVNELYAQIIKLAKETPFEVEQLTQTTFMLKGMGVETRELVPTLQALGNMAAVAGQDKLPLIAKAFTDVMNKGKLMKQEINQFAENGIPLYDLLADSLGKSRQQIIKMAEDHTISFAMVKKAIMDASQEGGRYYNLMNLQAQTLGGQVSNMSDRFFLAKARIGDFYEDGLKKTISGLSNFIDYVAGSNTALERTESVLKAAVAGLLAMRAATITETVTTGALTIAKSALNVVYGAYLLAVRAATQQQVVYTASQQAATVAAQGLWAAMRANPLGIILTVVGTLYAAWESYNAITAETTVGIGDQQAALEKEQATLQGLVARVLNAAEGTDQRRQAMELLIAKYPEYFAGLDAERTSNTDLVRILGNVNRSYEDRIALAREAYRTDVLQEKQKKLLAEELELMERLPKNLQISFGFDITKAVDELSKNNGELLRNLDETWKQKLGIGDFVFQDAKRVSDGLKQIRTEFADNDVRIANMRKVANESAINDENTRHLTVMNQLKAAHQSTKAEEELHEKNLAKLRGDAQVTQIRGVQDTVEKVKKVTLLSAADLAIINQEGEADKEKDRLKQLQAQLDFLEKQKKAEQDSIATAKVNRKISNEELAALKEAARTKAIAIDAKYDKLEETIRKEIEAEKQAQFLRASKETSDKIMVVTAQRLEAERMLVKLNDAKTNEDRVAALREYNDKFELAMKTQATDQLRIQLENSKKVLDDVKARTGEQGDEYRAAYKQWLHDNEQYNTALTTQTVTAVKETAQQIKEYEKEIQAAQKETAQLDKETMVVQSKSRREIIGLTLDLLSQQSGLIGQAGTAIKAVMNNLDGLSSKAAQIAQDEVTNAQIYVNNIKTTYEAGTAQGDAAIAQANQRLAEANNNAANVEAKALTATVGIVSAVTQAVLAIAAAVQERVSESYKAAAEGVQKVRDAYRELYDMIAQSGREAYERQLDMAKDNTQQQLAIIEDFYRRQDELADSTTRIDAELAYTQKFLELRGEQKKFLLAFEQDKKDAEYREQARAAQEQILLQASIDALERKKQKAKDVYDAEINAIDEYQRRFKDAVDERIDKLNDAADLEIDSINSVADKKKDALNTQLAELKTAYDTQVKLTTDTYNKELQLLRDQESAKKAEIQATFDLKQRLLEQSTSDEIEKIGIIDRARNEALERYRVDEVDKLAATRDRILATLTDEGERTRVTNEYAQRIGQVHKDVEDAKLDKTKGVSLATTQLRNEEKDTAERLKQEEKDALAVLEQNFQVLFEKLADQKDARLEKLKQDSETRENELKAEIKRIEEQSKAAIEAIQSELKAKTVDLQNQVAQNEAESAIKKKIANAEYTNAVIQMNRQLFEANKQMKVAEIQAEIAILNAQKSWTGIGNGKINEAIGQLQQAISSIQGLSAGGQEVAVDGGYSRDPVDNSNRFNLSKDELQYIVDMNKAGGRDKISLRNGAVGGPSLPVREDTLSLLAENQEVGLYRNGKPAWFSYDASGKRVEVTDGNGRPVTVAFARGFVPSTGEHFNKGTDFVEGQAYPDGNDTVPAWLTKGERVMTAEQNRRLMGLSNEELVRQIEAFQNLNTLVPRAGLLSSQAMLSGRSGGESLDLNGLNESLSSLRDALLNQQHVAINIDRGGLAIHTRSQQGLQTYLQNLFTR